MIISDYYEILLLTITGISMLSSTYTICLIIWVTPKSMSEYRWFLLLYTSWDLEFSFSLGIFLAPRLFYPGRGAIVQGLARDLYFLVKDVCGPEYSYYVIKIAVCSVIVGIVNIIACQDYCLLYRFTVILPNSKYHNLLVSKKGVAIVITILFLLCLLFLVPFYFFLADEKDIPKYIQQMNETNPGTFNDLKPDSISLYMDEYLTLFSVLLGLVSGGFILSEIICYFCVSKILQILRENSSSFSATTYKLHRQMTYLLYLQITNPLIIVIIPIYTCFIGLLFHWNYHPWTGIAGLLFMSLYSISNAIITISFVTPYRQFTKKYTFDLIMKLPFPKKNVVQIVSSTGLTTNSQNVRNIY